VEEEVICRGGAHGVSRPTKSLVEEIIRHNPLPPIFLPPGLGNFY
jgi:hypothetical protein